MTLQHEGDDRKAPPCTECGGEGTIAVKPIQGDVEIWGVAEEPCPRCEGTGRTLCAECGDTVAQVLAPAPDAEWLCWDCEAVRSEREAADYAA